MLELTPNTGSKIDHLLTLTRIDFSSTICHWFKSIWKQIGQLRRRGGDWERRNRFKAYNGIYMLATRNFAEAAKLLIDSLATFTSTELCSYEAIAHCAIVAGVLSLERVDLKTK